VPNTQTRAVANGRVPRPASTVPYIVVLDRVSYPHQERRIPWLSNARRELSGVPYTSTNLILTLNSIHVILANARFMTGTNVKVRNPSTFLSGVRTQEIRRRRVGLPLGRIPAGESLPATPQAELTMDARQQAALAELSQALLTADDLVTSMAQTAACAARILDAEYSMILQSLPGQDALRLRAGTGWQEGAVGATVIELEPGMATRFASHGMPPVMVADWRHEKRFQQPLLLREHNVISTLWTTVPGLDHPFGIIGVASAQSRNFTDNEVQVLQAIAQLLALVIERKHTSRMLEQRVLERTRDIERRHRVADSLHEILSILNSNRTLDEILDFIIAQACRLLSTSGGAIYRLDRSEGLLKIQAACGLEAADVALSIPVSWEPATHAVRSLHSQAGLIARHSRQRA
jgi:GAF domain-containing protein